MSRYEYQKIGTNSREVLEETDSYISYKPSKEDYDLLNKEGMIKESCVFTGRDILSKNINYLTHKVIKRIEELYSKETSKYIEDYFSELVKYEMRTMILNKSVPRKMLKTKGFESLYNLVNFHKRIYETIHNIDKLVELIDNKKLLKTPQLLDLFFKRTESYFNELSKKEILFQKGEGNE